MKLGCLELTDYVANEEMHAHQTISSHTEYLRGTPLREQFGVCYYTDSQAKEYRHSHKRNRFQPWIHSAR